MCTGIGWDKDGDMLAVINDKTGVVFLWDANTGKMSQMDSGFRLIYVILCQWHDHQNKHCHSESLALYSNGEPS